MAADIPQIKKSTVFTIFKNFQISCILICALSSTSYLATNPQCVHENITC